MDKAHISIVENMAVARASVQWTIYQKFVVFLLAVLQFTVVLDFGILSPLGVFLLDDLRIGSEQFGALVSVYAWGAGIAGFLGAGIADRFDRRKWLMFFYGGFIAGTLLCALAHSYIALMAARAVTGIFGGMIAGIGSAIVADLFPYEERGRVMGFVQSAFSASQVLGIPTSLYLATHWDWRAPFWGLVVLGVMVWILILFRLRPLNAHLQRQSTGNPLHHLAQTIMNPRYVNGLSIILLLATGGYMLMPFASTFSIHNLRISAEHLPWVYMITGAVMMLSGPWIGRLSDSWGKLPVFIMGSLLAMSMVLYYTRLGPISLSFLIAIQIVLFFGLNCRMISAQALLSGVPDSRDRGAYMALQGSLQHFSGGVAAWLAGHIIRRSPSGELLRYPLLGWVVAGAMLLTVIQMIRLYFTLKRREHES